MNIPIQNESMCRLYFKWNMYENPVGVRCNECISFGRCIKCVTKPVCARCRIADTCNDNEIFCTNCRIKINNNRSDNDFDSGYESN